jgi:hypothetical protein
MDIYAMNTARPESAGTQKAGILLLVVIRFFLSIWLRRSAASFLNVTP